VVKKSSINSQKEVMMGIVDLIRHKIFYGHILQQLTKVYGAAKYGIPTMGVGKQQNELLIKLYVNEEFIKHIFEIAKTEEQAHTFLQGVLEHETLHIIFDHIKMEFSDPVRGNVACDLAVNSHINHSNLTPGACLPDKYNLESGKGAFWYYTHLKDNQQYKKQCKQGAFGAGGMMEEVGSHEMWKTAAQDPLLQEFCKDIVSKARDLCNQDYGDVPGEVISQVDMLLGKKKAIIPWNKVLRTFAASATESNLDYTVKRVSKRFGTRPGTRKEDVLNLAVAVDTSGSISDDQLKLFFNEVKWIWKNGAIVTMYEADCKICRVYEFKGKFKGEVHGRGGTDLEPVLVATERRFDALIYFTDFYAPNINTRYRIPTLWVLTTELERDEFPYKWGRFVKIDSGKPELV